MVSQDVKQIQRILDGTYIDWTIGGKLPHKTLLIQVPKHNLPIRRRGQQCAERP